jgi:stage II sporulation protein GA (sporulation sigma-E factor processing peptidase)
MLNFLLDMMLLFLTQALARESIRKKRIVFGAVVASLIVPVSFYFPDSFFASAMGKFMYSMLIIYCSFGYNSFHRMVKLLFLFYFVSFSIGGGLIAIHFLFQQPVSITANGILTVNQGYGDPISWLFVIIGFPFVWWFTKRRMDRHVAEKIRYDQLCPVTLQIKQQSCSTSAYIDSGNQLLDPITKKPVILCDETFLKQWFSEEDWEHLKQLQEYLDFTKIPEKWENFIQIVPYQGVQGKSMFLLTVRPDKITILYENKKIVTSHFLVGIQFAELTKDRSYHCLLHPQMIQLPAIHSA